MEQTQHRLLFTISAVLLLFSSAAQPFIGVNYGQVADNLPPARRDGAAAAVDLDIEGPPLRRRPRHPQRPRQHRHLHHDRRVQRRHPVPRRRPLRRLRLGLRQRPPLPPRLLHLHSLRRQRDLRARRPLPLRPAPPGHAEPPLRARRQPPVGRRQGLHRQHHGRAVPLGAPILRSVPPGAPPAAPGGPRLPQPDRLPVHGQPLPLLRLRLRPPPGDPRVLPLPPQRRPARRRHRGHLHQHVRRAARRGQVRAGGGRVRWGGDRRRGDRVALPGGRGRARRQRRERQGVQWQLDQAPGVGGRHAADAREVGGHLHFRALRRGSQARPHFRAVVRALPAGSHHELRCRSLQVLFRLRFRLGLKFRPGKESDGHDSVVRAEGGNSGRATAGGPRLRLRPAGGRLRSDPAGRGVLRARHRAVARRLRDEPAVPGVGEELGGLRLQPVGYAQFR
ncbi:putative glucan endo-1,3-beta-glucosidase 7 [Iris pallida]|uniref:Glucan endo-1,3-beta-glucosidase 7 n=1 Tax=Iris pallida TaxID=29817 RepID=A0AAX6FGQ9_IRIPA|nr:putative glucan endo-1,3-beta-glucosidase 7 [Iris pallida]